MLNCSLPPHKKNKNGGREFLGAFSTGDQRSHFRLTDDFMTFDKNKKHFYGLNTARKGCADEYYYRMLDIWILAGRIIKL